MTTATRSTRRFRGRLSAISALLALIVLVAYAQPAHGVSLTRLATSKHVGRTGSASVAVNDDPLDGDGTRASVAAVVTEKDVDDVEAEEAGTDARGNLDFDEAPEGARPHKGRKFDRHCDFAPKLTRWQLHNMSVEELKAEAHKREVGFEDGASKSVLIKLVMEDMRMNMAREAPTIGDLMAMTLGKLRIMCRDRDLPFFGDKAMIARRIDAQSKALNGDAKALKSVDKDTLIDLALSSDIAFSKKLTKTSTLRKKIVEHYRLYEFVPISNPYMDKANEKKDPTVGPYDPRPSSLETLTTEQLLAIVHNLNLPAATWDGRDFKRADLVDRIAEHFNQLRLADGGLAKPGDCKAKKRKASKVKEIRVGSWRVDHFSAHEATQNIVKAANVIATEAYDILTLQGVLDERVVPILTGLLEEWFCVKYEAQVSDVAIAADPRGETSEEDGEPIARDDDDDEAGDDMSSGGDDVAGSAPDMAGAALRGERYAILYRPDVIKAKEAATFWTDDALQEDVRQPYCAGLEVVDSFTVWPCSVHIAPENGGELIDAEGVRREMYNLAIVMQSGLEEYGNDTVILTGGFSQPPRDESYLELRKVGFTEAVDLPMLSTIGEGDHQQHLSDNLWLSDSPHVVQGSGSVFEFDKVMFAAPSPPKLHRPPKTACKWKHEAYRLARDAEREDKRVTTAVAAKELGTHRPVSVLLRTRDGKGPKDRAHAPSADRDARIAEAEKAREAREDKEAKAGEKERKTKEWAREKRAELEKKMRVAREKREAEAKARAEQDKVNKVMQGAIASVVDHMETAEDVLKTNEKDRLSGAQKEKKALKYLEIVEENGKKGMTDDEAARFVDKLMDDDAQRQEQRDEAASEDGKFERENEPAEK